MLMRRTGRAEVVCATPREPMVRPVGGVRAPCGPGLVGVRPTELTEAMTHERPAPVSAWHAVAESRDPAGLAALLADDCVFRSPAVHTPQEGKAITTAYLTAAMVVLGPQLSYLDEWYAETPGAGGSAVLEFETVVDGLTVHGVDMLRWGADGLLTSFTVMVRPVKGLQALIGAMAAELTRAASA